MLVPDLIIKERYQLQRPLGRGGFSVVWLALDLAADGKPVALKFSVPEKDPSGEQPFRMEKQHNTTKTLNHKHLLCSHSFFMYGESGCLVFDYMAGGTLHNKVKLNGVLPEREVAKLIYQIGNALQYLHEKSLVHFDIKPENILIDNFGDYYLSDFDTASRLENSMVRVSRIYADTPQYRSPEHLRGASELSEKIDIFAFGTTIFESCEGIMEKEYGIGMTLLSGLPKPNFQGNYAKRLENLVHACWNHNPSDRPTADALTSYANHFFNQKFWPPVLEYKPNDKPITGPASKNAETARVTVGRPTIIHTQPSVRPASYRPSIKQSFSNFRSSATQLWHQSINKTQIMNPESTTRKWILPAIGVTIIVVAAFFIIRHMIIGYQYEQLVKKSETFLSQNLLKEAYDAASEAKTMRPSDSIAIKLRWAILRKAKDQHFNFLDQARQALKNSDSNAIAGILNTLELNKSNASILVAEDSTLSYVGKLKASIAVNPAAATSGNDWPDEPVQQPVSGTDKKQGQSGSIVSGGSGTATSGNKPAEPVITPVTSGFKGSRYGALGITSAQNRCGTDESDRNFTSGGELTITPKRKIKLLSGVMYTNDIGRATVTITGRGESFTGRFRLLDGYNDLHFSDADGLSSAVLMPGVTYTITVSLSKTAGTKPSAENSKCPSSSTSNGDLSIGYGGNYILYDLKYQAE